MAIRKSEEYEVGGDKVGIERLKAPFDGDQSPEGVVASLMDGFVFSVALRPNVGHSLLLLEVSRSHTTTHHSR
jgi:hypothetical protein